MNRTKNVMALVEFTYANLIEKIYEYRAILPQVTKIVQLLLVIPATSATSERSFSSFRLLKNFLKASGWDIRIKNSERTRAHALTTSNALSASRVSGLEQLTVSPWIVSQARLSQGRRESGLIPIRYWCNYYGFVAVSHKWCYVNALSR